MGTAYLEISNADFTESNVNHITFPPTPKRREKNDLMQPNSATQAYNHFFTKSGSNSARCSDL